jgi:glycosidase
MRLGQFTVASVIASVLAGVRGQVQNHTSVTRDVRIFEVMVESFIHRGEHTGYGCGFGCSHHLGDIAGIRAALPYIQSTGANTLWVTPVFESEYMVPNAWGEVNCKMDASGYFARNFFKIDPRFGSWEEFRDLVHEAHALDIWILMDFAPGHNKGNVYPSPEGRTLENRLNFNRQETRDYFKEVAEFWVRHMKIDGFRIDQAYQMPARYYPELSSHINAVCREVHARDCFIVGEVLCGGKFGEWEGLGHCEDAGHDNLRGTHLDYLQTPWYSDRGIPNIFNFPMMFLLRNMIFDPETTISAAAFEEAFHWQDYHAPKGSLTLVLNNHDFPRPGNKLWWSPSLPHFKKGDEYDRRHLLAFAFMAAYPGPIQWFYNDEIGLATEGYRAGNGGWNCVARGTCDDHVGRISGKIDDLTYREEKLKSDIAGLLRLRDSHPALGPEGSHLSIWADHDVWACLRTHPSGDKVVFILNKSRSSQFRRVPIPGFNTTLDFDVPPVGFLFRFF